VMLKAKSDSELIGLLTGLDISVPRRTKGRTTEHTERYSIAHLLSALVGKDRIYYPLNLTKRERPDFLLTLDGMKVGIEHTEAVPSNVAHKDALRGQGNVSKPLFIQHHQPGEEKKSTKELKKEIEANDPGDGWVGDKPERALADAIIYFIDKKIVTMQKDGFEKFEQNWLLIYDNCRLPMVDRNEAMRLVQKRIIEEKARQEFDRIYVITGQYLCEFDCKSNDVSIQMFDANDLWG